MVRACFPHVVDLTKFGMRLPARVCPRLVPQASDALPGLGRAVHHQRDKSGQCEGRREEGECHQSDHDQRPLLGRKCRRHVMVASCRTTVSGDVTAITEMSIAVRSWFKARAENSKGQNRASTRSRRDRAIHAATRRILRAGLRGRTAKGVCVQMSVQIGTL